MRTTAEELFWAYAHVKPGCWDWLGSDRSGYGRLWQPGVRKHLRAHRFAYQLLVGPIPDGMVLDHLCRNKGCVNPDHLEPVTQSENIRRGTRWQGTPTASTSEHCAWWHSRSPENVVVDSLGRLLCRECQHEYSRRSRLRRKTTRPGAASSAARERGDGPSLAPVPSAPPVPRSQRTPSLSSGTPDAVPTTAEGKASARAGVVPSRPGPAGSISQAKGDR